MKKMRIALRLFLAFSVMVFLAGIVGVVGISQIGLVWNRTVDLYGHPFLVSRAALDVQVNINAIHRSMKDVVLSESTAEMQEYLVKIDKNVEKTLADFSVLFKNFLGERETVQRAYDNFLAWEPIRQSVIDLKLAGQDREAIEITKTVGADHVDTLNASVDLMLEYAANKAQEFMKDAETSKDRHLYTSIALLIISMVAAAVIGVLMNSTTIKPIITMRDHLQDLLVTNREQAERILQLSEHRFEVALRSVPFPTFVHAEDGEVLMVSESFERISGYTLEDVPTVSAWVNRAYPGRSSEMKDYIDHLYHLDRVEVNHDVEVTCKDGTKKIWTFNAAPLGPQADGRRVVISMAMDVTQAKQYEQMISEEKERLSVTLRSIGDGVITTDTEGKVLLMNRVAESLTGWTQRDAIGEDLEKVFKIIHEETRKPHVNPVKRVLETGSIIELENHTVLLAKDGKERIIADSGAPVRDKNSRIIGVVLVFRDQTEAIKLQNSLQRNDKLESLGILAGGLAHDFNNLLGGLFGYIELARVESAEEKVRDYLANATEVFNRAKALTQQLLTFARGGDPIRKHMRIDDLVRKNTTFILAGTDIAVDFQIEADLWNCRVDQHQIGQVVDNLVLNASQAMVNGGVIKIRLENIHVEEGKKNQLRSGDYIALSVEDSGVGIPIDLMKKIFDPFFTTKPSGNGLGLATCYSIVKQHDGIIDVSSMVGRGSCFTVYLPRDDGDELPDVVHQPTDGQEAKHVGSGLILLLDDEHAVRDVVRRMIQSMGYEVITAVEGDSAIRKAGELLASGRTIIAALLDLTIQGGRGGYESVNEIREMFPGCVIFATSGYSNNPIIAHPEEFGFDASIHKPFRLQDLMELFSEHLGHLKNHTTTGPGPVPRGEG